MNFLEAELLQKAWGGKPCRHLEIENLFSDGLPKTFLNRVVCRKCGHILNDQQVLEFFHPEDFNALRYTCFELADSILYGSDYDSSIEFIGYDIIELAELTNLFFEIAARELYQTKKTSLPLVVSAIHLTRKMLTDMEVTQKVKMFEQTFLACIRTISLNGHIITREQAS